MDKEDFILHFAIEKPERSFFWKGNNFQFITRCTGIHIGYITFPLFMFNVFTLNIWWTLALMLPTYIDGLTQAFFQTRKQQHLRVTTGLMEGIKVMSLVAIIGKYIGTKFY